MIIAALLLALADPTPGGSARDVTLETGVATAAATGLCFSAGVVSYNLLFGEANIDSGLQPLAVWTLATPTFAVTCGAAAAVTTPMLFGEAPSPWALAGTVAGGALGALALGGPGAVWLLSSSLSEDRSLQGWVVVIGAGLGFAAGAGAGAALGQSASNWE